ncbi:MAG: hypothetical protein ACI381_08810 [Candidatus Methanomethylophilaceae archaeon]
MILGKGKVDRSKTGPEKTAKVRRKGRGKRAQETIRETRQIPRTKTHVKSDGPPIGVGRASKKKPVRRPSITPDEAVKNRRQ